MLGMRRCEGFLGGGGIGTVVSVLASHQRGLGLILAQCRKLQWNEFVVGSRVLRRSFLSAFSGRLSTKINISKFQFNQDKGSTLKPAKADVTSSLNII